MFLLYTILQIEIPEPIVNGTKSCMYHAVFLYESKSNVVYCCCCIRDQRGERVSAKVDNNESLIIEEGGGLDTHGHPPNPEEVEKERILSQIK